MHVSKENNPLQAKSQSISSTEYKGRSMAPPPLQLTAEGPGGESSTATDTTSPTTASPETMPLNADDPDFVQQLVDLADYRFLSNRNSSMGWHNSLYEAPKEEETTGKKKKNEPVDPLEGVLKPEYANLKDSSESPSITPEVVDKYCAQLSQRLTNVPFPTNNGTGFKEKRSGHQYMARSHDKNDQAAAHTEWGKNAGMDVVGYDDPSNEEKILWKHFKIVLGEEGDTSAINSWDAQIVTIGAGFGAKFGQAGSLLARLPEAYLDQLYQVGIYVGPDGNVRFLQATEKKVYEGREAWKKIKENENLLAYFSNLAQSTEMIEEDGNPDEKVSMRDAMLRAQWEQFLHNNTKVFKTPVKSGPWNTRQMAIKMHHWLPGVFNWKSINGIPTDFDAAFKWGKKKLKDSGQSKYLGQYERMKRFKKVTSQSAAEKYAEGMFNR